MTEENKENKELKEFTEAVGEVQKIGELGEKAQKHPRGEVKDKATKELREYAYKIAKAVDPNYNGKAEDLQPEEMQRYVGLGQKMAQENAAKKLHNNIDSIIEQIPEKGLEKILGDEESIKAIIYSAPEDARDKIKSYLGYKGLESVVKKYKETGEADQEQRKQITALAAKGASEEQRKRLKEKGYSIEIQDLGAQLAGLAVQLGHYEEDKVKEYAVSGLSKQLKETKEKVGEVDIRKEVGRSLKTMVKSDKPDIYNAGFDLAYRAAA